VIKEQLARMLPRVVIDAYRSWRIGGFHGRTVERVFSDIYSRNLWGGPPGDFYSGTGSDSAVAEPYVDAVSRFITSNGIRSIVDLGCGDFRVGRQLVIRTGVSYHGVDVVPELVARNVEVFGGEGVTFSNRDITTDALPQAEVCLIRQVLQHLSNEQVSRVLRRCEGYRYLIVTEHFPGAVQSINLDIPHGPHTRVDYGSGLFLDQPPFRRSIIQVLCDVPIADGSRIKTMVVAPSQDSDVAS